MRDAKARRRESSILTMGLGAGQRKGSLPLIQHGGGEFIEFPNRVCGGFGADSKAEVLYEESTASSRMI